MVKNKNVRFSFYREKRLFCRTEDGFEFPVPIDGNATFLAEDKVILFMRWIRKHIDTIGEGENRTEEVNVVVLKNYPFLNRYTLILLQRNDWAF